MVLCKNACLQVKSLLHLSVFAHHVIQQYSQSGCWTGRQETGHLLGLGQSAPVRSLTKVKLTRCVGKGETGTEFQSISQKKLSWITWNICIFPVIYCFVFLKKFLKNSLTASSLAIGQNSWESSTWSSARSSIRVTSLPRWTITLVSPWIKSLLWWTLAPNKPSDNVAFNQRLNKVSQTIYRPEYPPSGPDGPGWCGTSGWTAATDGRQPILSRLSPSRNHGSCTRPPKFQFNFRGN